MARLMSESTSGHPHVGAASSSATSTSNVTSSPRTSRKPASSNMATEENLNTSPKRISLQRTSSTNQRSKTTVSPPRRPSFKLQQIRPGGPKTGYRATKVTVPSNSVALLASQFNAVVVQNDAEGRKLLKRLNSQKKIVHTHKNTSIEGCVKAAIRKFESGAGESGEDRKNTPDQHSLQLQKTGKVKVHNGGLPQNHSHQLRNSVLKSSKEKDSNYVHHQKNGTQHQNGTTQHQNGASSAVHHQQTDRPKFVIVRKNSSISKFSRKSSQKGNSRLPSNESKDVVLKSGSSSTSPVKQVRKFPNPPKLTPKPVLNQRTIFLKPVSSQSAVLLKDNDVVCSGSSVRLSRTLKDSASTRNLKNDKSPRTLESDESAKTFSSEARRSRRADSDDSVFCSDDEADGKSSDGVPKTVKKIWRRYQVTNTRSISSIARDFINSDSSIDGSVVQTLKHVADNIDDGSCKENGSNGSEKVRKQVEQCEGCSNGLENSEKKNHSRLCKVQRRIHRGNEDTKVQKEVFRKYLVKSEHIVAVQNELMATNKKIDGKSLKETITPLDKDGKHLKETKNVADKEHKRYGRIIVNDSKVLKSLVNDGFSNEDVDKVVLDPKNAKYVSNLDVNISNEDVLVVDKENLDSKSAKHLQSAKSVEENGVVPTKAQVMKPKLQPKPSKLPEGKRKVQVVKDVGVTTISKPITTPSIRLSVPKDQTILESALNGNIKAQAKLGSESNGDVAEDISCVTDHKSSTAQKDLLKPNRSFLWNSLKDKDSTPDPKLENISVAETTNEVDKVMETKSKSDELLETNARNNMDSKVKNTSFLFRKNIKSLPPDDCLDEPIYMNGQVALSTSDIDTRLNSSNLSSNFSSMINCNGSLIGKECIADNLSVTRNGPAEDEKPGGPKFTKDVAATDSKNDVYEELGSSDSEGTIYEDVDTSEESPKASSDDPAFKYMNVYITEARNTNIIKVETVNKVVIVSQQATGYEEIEKVQGNGSGDYSGSKSSYAYIDPDGAHVGTKKVSDDTYASISGEDFSENIYDDVIHLKPKVHMEDSCHYECIYQSEIAGSSQSDSSCDQSNSLYGVVPVRQLSQSSLGVYQLNEPRANTSDSSDDWIDLDTSGGDVEIYLYEKRNKPKVKTSGSWSQKVRRQWSAKHAAGNSSWDGSSDYDNTSSTHQYEDVRRCTTSTTTNTSHPQQQRRLPPPQEAFSFHSDSSFEDDDDEEEESGGRRAVLVEATPPQAMSEGIYGFMKQASRRMRKHWSLGKSLRRIRKMSVGAGLGAGGGDEQTQQPAPVTNGSNTSLNRKRWSSFKSKFKPQLSSSGSVFYLDKDQNDTPDCIPNVYTDKPTTTTTSPTAVTMATSTSTTTTSTTTDYRRYSMASTSSSSTIRPTSPPPPPPPHHPSSVAHRQSLCEELLARRGVGLRSPGGGGGGVEQSPGNGEVTGRKESLGNSSWLLESDEGNTSWDKRTSGMMSDHSSSHGSDLHLRFADEPLYQFYNETVTKEELNKCYSTSGSSRGSIADFDSDGYEEIGNDRLISRPSAMDLINPKQGHHRTLWCEIPEVVQSEILKTLSKDERRLQEAKFEVMTSEASYFKSLTVLEKHFANSSAFTDETVLPTDDRRSLFGQLGAVRRCSERLLAALDRCWQDSIMLSHLASVVAQHAQLHFNVYVTYCMHQIDLNSTLRRLKDTNKRFEEELNRLESDPMCESLSLHSFLMLPMQRVTRMPLLMDAILSKLDTNHAEYQSSKMALRILNEFVQKCNEAARKQERVIEIVKLSRQLEFSPEVRLFPIVSQSRWLVRSGQLVQLNGTEACAGAQKQTFGRKLTRQGVKVTLFLFNDVMLVAKKKSEDSFIVLDHCQRNLIQMSAEDDVGNALKHLIKIAMLKNHEGKLVEMIVSCDSETSRERWLQAVAPPRASEPGESVYEAWDCPQVIAIHVYRASQPDELSTQRGDVINVLRKMADGWYYGERTRDGETGWFPGNHAQEIISQHIRARNLQQRYRLLMMSGSILESQKGNTNNKKQK